MTTKAVRKEAGAPMRGDLVMELRLQIRCRPHTTESLARKLAVSTATVARGIAELRRVLAESGESLVSVKEGKDWHYEIREREDVWENDPLVKAVGSLKGAKRPAGESVDDALYGKARTPK